MRQDIDADKVGKAKGSGARPANGGTGKRINLFNGEPLFQHQIRSVEQHRDADAVGDEVWRVMRKDDFLAEHAVGKSGKSSDQLGIAFLRGDYFKEAHVARRIEKVGPEELFLDLDWQCRGDLRYGQAGSVGRKDGASAEMRQNACEQRGFDFEIFGHGFDHPVTLCNPGQVVVEGAGRDEAAKRCLEECGGFGFRQCVKCPLRGFFFWR